MKNLTSLETKLSKALTERGLSFTHGQLTCVCNSDHELTFGKTFNNLINPSYFITEMVGKFIDFSNLSKFESDFKNL